MAPTATVNGTHTNGTTNGASKAHPKIHLYTNHRCPYAHRAHIVLQELGLPFEETIIDLDTPRPQWYLDINPRGLVPSMKYSIPGVMEEETIIESAIVSQFLCDSFPSHLLPSTDDPAGPLKRAKINFFTDNWGTKLGAYQMAVMKANTTEEKEEKCREWASAVEKEIEPLLADAAPFFGGSKDLTLAEAIAAPFLLRWYDISQDGEMIPPSFAKRLDALPNFSKWARAVRENESVGRIYDGAGFIERFKKKVKARMAAERCVLDA